MRGAGDRGLGDVRRRYGRRPHGQPIVLVGALLCSSAYDSEAVPSWAGDRALRRNRIRPSDVWGLPRVRACRCRADVKVAILVVAYESEAFIEQLLEAIPARICGAPPAILVSDDASTDTTATVAERWV